MRKTWAVLTVALLVVLLLATPGLVVAKGGHGGGGNGGTSFNLDGYILGDPDDVARTFVVDVENPESYTEPVTVQVTDETHLKLCGGDFQIYFDQLDDGDKVRVVGVIEGDTYVATRVILDE